MNSARPELIFLSGPQQGERAVLMTNTVLVGRSAAADVRLKENAASREQLRFQLTPEGWVMVNLSAHGTAVNGKRYKRKKLLLDTGDVLGVGSESEILYVSPGDDPEAALAAYRELHPLAAGPAVPVEAGGPKTKTAPLPAAVAKAPEETKGQVPSPLEARAEAPEGAEGAEAGGSNVRRYVLVGIVLVALVALGVAMIVKSLPEDQDDHGPGGPPRLDARDIRDAIESQPERTPSAAKANNALVEAVRMYSNRALWRKGDLYRCVHQYRLHLAHKHRSNQTFDKIQDEKNFHRARADLVQRVAGKYDAAWKYERARKWRDAKDAFEELLLILPVAEVKKDDPVVYRVILTNVLRHRSYALKSLGRVRG